MVKLTEVEDEHFTSEKPVPTNKEALLVSDNEEDDDFTDTGTFPQTLFLSEEKCTN
jgi:import receptor subunit TOM22